MRHKIPISIYDEDLAIIDSIAKNFNGNRSLAVRLICRRFNIYIREHPEVAASVPVPIESGAKKTEGD